MAQTQVKGTDVGDGSVCRVDLNINSSGQAVITKIVEAANTGIKINASSGADAGTGDVSLKIDKAYLDTLYVQVGSGSGFLVKAGVAGGQLAIGGSAVTDMLELQGTSGNGTATSPAIRGKVGNNGSLVSFQVLNNGNFGIGSTAPAEKLQIEGNAWVRGAGDSPTVYLYVGSWYGGTMSYIGNPTHPLLLDVFGFAHLLLKTQGKIAFFTGNAEKFKMDDNGKFGIGVLENLGALLHIKAGTASAGTAPIKLTSGTLLTTAEAGTIEYYSSNFYIRGGDGLRVEGLISGANVRSDSKYYIGSSAGSAGQILVSGGSSAAATWSGANATLGSYTMTASNFILSSDRRLKDKIHPLDGVDLEDISKIDFVRYVMKTDKEQIRFGVIAQEVERFLPELVRTDREGMKSVAYTDLMILKIANLENRLKRLENDYKN